MEEQRVKSDAEPFGGLLKKSAAILGILCLFSALFAQPAISQAQLDALRIRPSENQNFYTKSDIKFEVLIPGTSVNSVLLQNSTMPKGVTLRTMRKIQEYGDEAGAKIELWLWFDKKGDYKLPPLSLSINNRSRSISFEPLSVTDNPEFLLPRIVLAFPDGNYFYSDEPFDPAKPAFYGRVGQKIPFTLCIQYAVLLLQLDWELPADSIFTCTKNYESLEARQGERRVSQELIPVADFEWTVLAPGEMLFPKIRLTATAYNGSRVNLQTQDFPLNFSAPLASAAPPVSPSQSPSSRPAEESPFDKAFALFDSMQKSAAAHAGQATDGESDDESYGGLNGEPAKKSRISSADCELLAALRHKERTALFFHGSNVRERSEFESNLGIKASANEFNVGPYYFSALLLLACAGLLVLFVARRRIFPAIFLCFLVIFSLIFFIFVSIQKDKIYAISRGARITSVPEESARVESKIGEGLRVQVMEDAGTWIYVQLGESGGWCKKTDVVFIN